MVTGGFRTRAGMDHALQAGVAVVGLARPMVQMTDAPKQILGGLEVYFSRLSPLSSLWTRSQFALFGCESASFVGLPNQEENFCLHLIEPRVHAIRAEIDARMQN